MLQRIQTLLRQKGPLSLAALAQMLGSDPETVRPMLELLVRKGRVVREKRAACGGCFSCRPEELAVYSYVVQKEDTHAVSRYDAAFE